MKGPLLLTAREAQPLEEMQAMDRWATAVGNGDLAEIDNPCRYEQEMSFRGRGRPAPRESERRTRMPPPQNQAKASLLTT